MLLHITKLVLIDTFPDNERNSLRDSDCDCDCQLTLSVVTLGPVVTSSRLTEHEVVGPEDLSEGSGPHGVHGARLQVNQDGLNQRDY